MNVPTGIPLSSVPLEKKWPVVPSHVIALCELEQDEYFPYIEKEHIEVYIAKAIEYGEKVAEDCGSSTMKATDVMNQLLKKKISIRFVENNSGNPWIRAQYIRKPPAIYIYKSSIEQLQNFFNRIGSLVTEEDIIALHLFHEWFHYLEEKKYGKTDSLLPRIAQKTGLFPHRKKISKVREIAAHAFTQKALNLSWSPLVLDYLLLYDQKGLSKAQIREKFQNRMDIYEIMTKIEEISNEAE